MDRLQGPKRKRGKSDRGATTGAEGRHTGRPLGHFLLVILVREVHREEEGVALDGGGEELLIGKLQSGSQW